MVGLNVVEVVGPASDLYVPARTPGRSEGLKSPWMWEKWTEPREDKRPRSPPSPISWLDLSACVPPGTVRTTAHPSRYEMQAHWPVWSGGWRWPGARELGRRRLFRVHHYGG